MPQSWEQPFFLRDLFFELAKDFELLRPDFQQERDRWFREQDTQRKEEVLFELEMYLRAVGCFFNLHNQFSDRSGAIGQDFTEELKVLRAALERAAALAQMLLERKSASSLSFQSYIENQVAPDYLRLQLVRRTLDQKRPEESLFLLSRSLRDLKKVLDHLLKREPCPYILFYHFGQIVTREIAFNRFFNPLLLFDFRPEYDRIRSVPMLESIRTAPSQQEGLILKRISLALLRLLHYLHYIPGRGTTSLLRRTLIVFTLFHSEASTLANFLKVLASKKKLSSGLLQAATKVSEDIRQELRRILGEQVVGLEFKSSSLVGGREKGVKARKESLEIFLKECIVRFLQVYQPTIDGASVFDRTIVLREQAIRLREDLWLYRSLLEHWMKDFSPTKFSQLPPFLVSYHEYFRETAYNLLRYGDGGPFEIYNSLLAYEKETEFQSPKRASNFFSASKKFLNYLMEVYDFVCRRSDLEDHPIDETQLENKLIKWLDSGPA